MKFFHLVAQNAEDRGVDVQEQISTQSISLTAMRISTSRSFSLTSTGHFTATSLEDIVDFPARLHTTVNCQRSASQNDQLVRYRLTHRA